MDHRHGGGDAYYSQKRKQPESGDRNRQGNDPGISSIVANHYNSINNRDISERQKSKIYYMRNFNNWIKSIIIRMYIYIYSS